MPPLKVRFNQGENTSKDRADLLSGELVASTGAEYRSGDSTGIHTQKTRSEFDDIATETKILGMYLAQFNGGTGDQLLALAGTDLYGATPGLTGTMASLKSSLSASNDHLSGAHTLNKHYLCTGNDTNMVLEDDNTVYDSGMQAPNQAPVATITNESSQVVTRPDQVEDNNGFVDTSFAYDDSGDRENFLDTFAGGTLSSSIAADATITYSWPVPGASTSRKLFVKWRLAGFQVPHSGPELPGGWGIGGGPASGFVVDVKLEVTEDFSAGTPTWTTIAQQDNLTYAHAQPLITQYDIQDGTALGTDLAFRATLDYVAGTSPATLQLYDIRVQDASETTAFSTSSNLAYAYTEFDSVRGRESPPSPALEDVALSTENQVALDLPAAGVNSETSHYRIYRTGEGGAVPNQLGRIGEVPVGEDFVDDFTLWESTAQPLPLLEMITITDTQSNESIYLPTNTPPPQATYVFKYEGSLCYIVGQSLYFSIAGRPESVPELNSIQDFDFPVHDELIAGVKVGEQAVLGAKGLMIVLDTLPRVTQGVFNASKTRTLKGQPGLISKKGLVAFSVFGESRCAWVSPLGIHQSNGNTSNRLTDDIDWKNNVDVASLSSSVLEWDEDRQILIFSYDSDGGGTNDSVALIHMDPEDHTKENGRPKITWGTSASINDMTSGYVGGVYRVYSGHTSDGTVNVENSTGAENLSVKTGRRYSDTEFSIDWGTLRHSDGAGETITVAVTMGRDSEDEEYTYSQSVALDNQKQTEFWVELSGEWFEVELTYTGTTNISIDGITFKAEPMGRSGKVAV
jgi:hypothetical protein